LSSNPSAAKKQKKKKESKQWQSSASVHLVKHDGLFYSVKLLGLKPTGVHQSQFCKWMDLFCVLLRVLSLCSWVVLVLISLSFNIFTSFGLTAGLIKQGEILLHFLKEFL
jgi:hypothetical protein